MGKVAFSFPFTYIYISVYILSWFFKKLYRICNSSFNMSFSSKIGMSCSSSIRLVTCCLLENVSPPQLSSTGVEGGRQARARGGLTPSVGSGEQRLPSLP